jgi:hypothetical protein
MRAQALNRRQRASPEVPPIVLAVAAARQLDAAQQAALAAPATPMPDV